MVYYIILLCIHSQTLSDEVRMHEMFHVRHGVDAPPTRCKLRSAPAVGSTEEDCQKMALKTDRCFHVRYMVTLNRWTNLTKVGVTQSMHLADLMYNAMVTMEVYGSTRVLPVSYKN